MDNQPRLLSKAIHAANFSHEHMAWIDATLQQILSGKILAQMASVIGREHEVEDVVVEVERLTAFVNSSMWNERNNFYCDRRRDGTLSDVQSIGAYWSLLAGVLPTQRQAAFLAHLNDSQKFNRPHRVPSLAADTPEYSPEGDYWNGGVWAPANYMILRGLSELGEDDLAHEIAVNHHRCVVDVFKETGTLWEDYAPEKTAPGVPARPDFVGWSGLPPIAVLFEYVFGLRPNLPKRELLWDVRLLEEHGVARYPFGSNGVLDLHCGQRARHEEEPQVEITTSSPITLSLRWKGGHKRISAGMNR